MDDNITDIANIFGINLKDIQTKIKEYQSLELIPGDEDSFETCRKGLKICVSTRTKIEKERLALNQDDQTRIKKRNGDAKSITEFIAPAERHLSGLVKRENDRVKAIFDAEVEKVNQKVQARVDKLLEYGKDYPFTAVAAMDDWIYDDMLSKAKTDWQAEQDRLKEAQNAKEAEETQLKKVAKEQALEAERLAGIAAEQKKEQDRIAAEQKSVQDKIDADRKALDDTKRKDQERKDREAFEKKTAEGATEKARTESLELIGFTYPCDDLGTMPDHLYSKMYDEHRQDWDKAENEKLVARLKIDADRKTKEKKEAEEAAIKEAARVEAMKPDKELIIEYAQAILNIHPKLCKSDEAIAVMAWAYDGLIEVCQEIVKKAEEL